MVFKHPLVSVSPFSILFTLLLLHGPVFGQNTVPYAFQEAKNHACTPVKNQEQTGTCWSFSTTSFLESELMRLGKGEYDLSEMFVVRNIYRDKCENYVRRQGTAQFGEGGLAHDVLNAVRRYGLVPEEVYPGRLDPAKPYNHGNLVAALKQVCTEAVALAQKGELPAGWMTRVDSLLDLEFGPVPTKFQAAKMPMSPQRFRDFLGVNANDYVNITSFTHHPYYDPFVLEVPDNFSNGSFYNLPLDEFMEALNFALTNGYTVEWDADVSNADFSHKNGLAIVPTKSWKDKNEAQRGTTFVQWEPERIVTPEYRQELFDRQVTMDDHLMHIVGHVQEAHGTPYYVVKNSWGTQSERQGFVYVSDAYMRLNTISFTVHKDALPDATRRRLGFGARPGAKATLAPQQIKQMPSDKNSKSDKPVRGSIMAPRPKGGK